MLVAFRVVVLAEDIVLCCVVADMLFGLLHKECVGCSRYVVGG